MNQPNIPHLTQLAEWLEAGAPHTYFSMDIGICAATDDAVSSVSLHYTLEDALIGTAELAKPDCGSVCCIAGAAHLMSIAGPGEVFPSPSAQRERVGEDHVPWAETMEAALAYLGLVDEGTTHMGHPLFSHRLAPHPCSPAQAAVAVRRVIAGKEPWETD